MIKNQNNKCILVCKSKPCLNQKSQESENKLKNFINVNKIRNIHIISVSCLGYCGEGPVFYSEFSNKYYKYALPENIHKIFEIEDLY